MVNITTSYRKKLKQVIMTSLYSKAYLIDRSKLSLDNVETPFILSFIVTSSKKTTKIESTATAEHGIIKWYY